MRAVRRLAPIVGIAAAVLALEGCEGAATPPRDAPTLAPLPSGTRATAQPFSPPPVATGTALPAFTAPPLPPQPSFDPATVVPGSVRSSSSGGSSGSAGSARGTSSGSTGRSGRSAMRP